MTTEYITRNRERLFYSYFFNAGLDRYTGICDGGGSDIFELDSDGGERYLGSLFGYMPEEITRMSDDEFREAMVTSFVPPSTC